MSSLSLPKLSLPQSSSEACEVFSFARQAGRKYTERVRNLPEEFQPQSLWRVQGADSWPRLPHSEAEAEASRALIGSWTPGQPFGVMEVITQEGGPNRNLRVGENLRVGGHPGAMPPPPQVTGNTTSHQTCGGKEGIALFSHNQVLSPNPGSSGCLWDPSLETSPGQSGLAVAQRLPLGCFTGTLHLHVCVDCPVISSLLFPSLPILLGKDGLLCGCSNKELLAPVIYPASSTTTCFSNHAPGAARSSSHSPPF